MEIKMPKVLTNSLGSKKMLVFLAVAAATIFKDKLGLGEEQLTALVTAGAAYAAGQGLADFGKEKGKK